MLSNVAHKLVVGFDFPLFLAVHNRLFAYLDFVNQPEKRFSVKAFQIAVLPDKAYPFLHIVLYRLAVLYLPFQFLKPGGFSVRSVWYLFRGSMQTASGIKPLTLSS